MNSVLGRMSCLLRVLAPVVLALPLVLMPLGGSACASACGSGEPSVHECALHVSTAALPIPSEPPCCVADLVEGTQYLTSRQKTDSRRTPRRNAAIIQVLFKGPALSGSDTGFKSPPAPPALPSSDRLHVLHAAFLI
jgi:hypothetical protein